ncbi:MAG TPA: hypothetical protein VH914_20810 [Acidimicrobiia bacterium]|jgi:hypothetical protein|nr:hypothetical protein [Acidimicrobiia bacterium]
MDVQVARNPQGEIDVDALMPREQRAEVRALIDEGRALLPTIAEWGRRARPLLDQPYPDEVFEDEATNAAVMTATGLAELNDVMFLIALITGDPEAPPSAAVVHRLFHQYADLVGDQAPARA